MTRARSRLFTLVLATATLIGGIGAASTVGAVEPPGQTARPGRLVSAAANGGQALAAGTETTNVAAAVARVLPTASNIVHRVAWRTDVPALRAAGVEVGAELSEDDLVRAAKILGVRLGRTVRQRDVDRVMAAARRRTAPALWAAGIDFGTTVDEGDLRYAGRVLGVRAGKRLDPQDVVRILGASSRALSVKRRSAVAAGLTYERWRAAMGKQASVVHVLRWRWRDPVVDLRVEPAGAFGTRATVPAAARRRPKAVAVVNGGLWVGGGEPDGLLISGGRLMTDPTMGRFWVRGQRGAFGIGDGGYVVGRPDWEAHVDVAGVGALPIGGVNRALGRNDLVVYTPSWGVKTRTPPGSVTLTIEDLALTPSFDETRTISSRWRGNTAIPKGGIVLAASGRAAESLRAAQKAADVHLRIAALGDWSDSREALASGPLLIQNAQRTSVEEWRTEGFGPRHTDGRHPRTALGFTSEGEAILVVVDGRQPGYSAGMSIAETTALLRAFGATDAVMLDGGGSSHMVVRGKTVNLPCCDGRPRPVATTLVFYRGS
ncbi:MAG: phosphodiester glycosidase family protein [Nitriliruptorales bacterium]